MLRTPAPIINIYKSNYFSFKENSNFMDILNNIS